MFVAFDPCPMASKTLDIDETTLKKERFTMASYEQVKTEKSLIDKITATEYYLL